jgi:formylglycine-generating enzyme required for sulfatase activity
MKRLFCFVLVVAFVTLASDLAGSIAPDRKPGDEKDPPKNFTNSIGMKFVWIPPGNFMMGSPKEEKERADNETQHKVTLTKGFFMGVYTVTQEEWQAVMGKNPSFFKGEKNLPVDTVSWDDCQAFIKKLREKDKDKKAYRLPTEAEWEYCCRAGTKTPFSFGETISTDQANYIGDFTYGEGKKGVYRKKTTPVGSFPANTWGLHDMHGNLWQWCQDWYGDYPQKDVVDPQGADNGKSRVLRGGSWFFHPRHCRSAYRSWLVPGGRYGDCGFRVVFCLD